MRIYLQLPPEEGKPMRFYHLFLQPDLLDGWNLVKEWGYQGAGGTLKREHYPDYDAAEVALLKSRDAQIKRGYRVVFIQGSKEH